MNISREETLKAVDDIFNYCEEIDNSLPENELMQKCYISDNQYSIGYYEGLKAAKDMIEKRMGE